jgi:thiamine transport system substrate-binding protein
MGWRMRRLALVLVCFSLIAAACSNDDDDDGQPAAETPDDPGDVAAPDEPDAPDEPAAPDEPDEAPAPSDVTLTVVTNDSFSSVSYLLDAFTAETGIGIELLAGGDAGSLVNQAILTKGNPLGDVIYGFDNTFLSRVLDEGITIPYESPNASVIPADLQLDPAYNVTAVDFGDVCINYDKSWFVENDVAVPETLAQLVDPEYEGLLVVENPATSSPGLAFVLATISEFGEDGWLDFWQGLVDNDVEVVSGWDDAYYTSFSGSAGAGPRPLVVSYASSPPAEVIFADPPTDVAPTGVMVESCFRQVEYIGILDGTDNVAEAQQLIDWWLSDSLQAELPLNYFVFPINPATPLPQEFIDYTIVPDDPQTVAPELIAEKREEWLDDWTSTVLR